MCLHTNKFFGIWKDSFIERLLTFHQRKINYEIGNEFGNIDLQAFDKSVRISRFTNLSQNKNNTTVRHGMKSIAVSVPEPFHKEKRYAALSVTMFLYDHQIYRIKGFVKFEGSDETILIQSTGNKLTFTKPNFSKTESPNLVFVFIGKNIQRQSIEKILSRTLIIA
ncbi:GTP-binding protein [Belliella sp. DSM 111904]|uniref:GTP-binding protein n=1 Tax=Belliella filtrata TaxID=2923435 RepID=A0ABS9V524_9BACT|nr:GTP-binding protein [Belliella filtrata]MCH7411498.1 GTP-binding protein [Belliella filtrata]